MKVYLFLVSLLFVASCVLSPTGPPMPSESTSVHIQKVDPANQTIILKNNAGGPRDISNWILVDDLERDLPFTISDSPAAYTLPPGQTITFTRSLASPSGFRFRIYNKAGEIITLKNPQDVPVDAVVY